MDDLLIKYIMEEATPEESNQVQQWLAADAANRARFENLQAIWQLAAQPNLQRATDTPQALQRLKQTLQERETASIKRMWPRAWTAAAAVVGMAGVALGAYVMMKPKATVKEQPPIVQPDTVLQQRVTMDTALTMPPPPTVQPVPALPADTLPVVKPHKKKRPVRVTPEQHVRPKKKRPEPTTSVQPVHHKKKRLEPVTPLQSVSPKKKRPEPVHPVRPVKKHKSAPRPASPPAPVKEPPIS
jgi:hypothetical protein